MDDLLTEYAAELAELDRLLVELPRSELAEHLGVSERTVCEIRRRARKRRELQARKQRASVAQTARKPRANDAQNPSNSAELRVSYSSSADPKDLVTGSDREGGLGETGRAPAAPDTPAPRRRKPRAENKPVECPADWMPSPELLAALATKHDVPVERLTALVPEFRWYWREGQGSGTTRALRGWSTTYGNHVQALAKRGTLWSQQPTRPRGGPPQPNSGFDFSRFQT